MQSDPPATIHPRRRAELRGELPTYKNDEFPDKLKRNPEEKRNPPPIFLYGFACNEATLVRYAENNNITVRQGIEFSDTVRSIRDHMKKAFNTPFVRISPLDKRGEQGQRLYGVAAYNNRLYYTAPPCLEAANKPTIPEVIGKIRLALEIFDEPRWYAESGITWSELKRFI
ncbi:hypothetical protein EWM64_g1350 [Hericium alpestre]|uniref:Uncharacterized protein n=1 Tax=Hericium alpestre TaxID=135208 RepID=A0A4Z0A9Q7_9AGAM|nr:hypothetical protein EWM64_g1350 [Hericium alpestre]